MRKPLWFGAIVAQALLFAQSLGPDQSLRDRIRDLETWKQGHVDGVGSPQVQVHRIDENERIGRENSKAIQDLRQEMIKGFDETRGVRYSDILAGAAALITILLGGWVVWFKSVNRNVMRGDDDNVRRIR